MLTTRKTVAGTCRKMGISETTIARWRELEVMEAALLDKDELGSWEDVLARQRAEAERAIGQLALENDLLGEASRRLK